jgi:hypothetical protein
MYEVFTNAVEFLVATSILLNAIQVYLRLNKLWSRRHQQAVAESLSIYAIVLGIVSNTPQAIHFLIRGEWTFVFKNGLKIVQLVVNFAIAIGIWVPDPQGRSVWQKFTAAVLTERDEVGDIVKSLVQPAGAPLLLAILHQVAMADDNLDAREREFIEKFAVTWGLKYDHEQMSREHGGGDPVKLRRAVEEYLAIAPPTKQVAMLRDVLDALANIDDEVAEAEALILGEVMGMLTEYVSEDDKSTKVDVLIVPQNAEQTEAIGQLFAHLTAIEHLGGSAFLVGSYYSGAYAEMVAAKYRAMNFFSIVDTHVSSKAKRQPKDDKGPK